jgi:rubrerythrin
MNKYQYAFDKLSKLTSPDIEQSYELEVRGADYYHELLDTLYDLVEKETATQPDIEGDGYYKGELVYDTWICPRCGTRYEIGYDEYEYCPKCGQHIDLDSLEQECEDAEDEE